MVRSLKNREFGKVYQQGKSKADDCLVLYILENGTDVKHLGITVSKKIGNSVVRSRVKRIIKEAWRMQEPYLADGYDYVWIARASAKEKKSTEIEISIQRLARKFRLYRGTEGKKEV